MLQPGRFDVLIYLGISEDADSRKKIIAAQTRKMRLGCAVEEVEEIMPKGYTGADVYNYVSSAYKKAMLEVKASIAAQIPGSNLTRAAVKELLRRQMSGGERVTDIKIDLRHFEAFGS